MTLTFIIKNTKWNRLLIILIFISSSAIAQKDAQFSLFSLNQLFLNPAAAGAGGLTQFQLTHRTQYAGYQGTNPVDEGGALSTQLLSFSMPIKNFGIGFYALNDRSGPRTDQDFKVSASYQRKATTGVEVKKEYALNINVKCVQDEIPAGLEKILNMLAA